MDSLKWKWLSSVAACPDAPEYEKYGWGIEKYNPAENRRARLILEGLFLQLWDVPLMFTRKFLITLVAKKNDVGDKCGAVKATYVRPEKVGNDRGRCT